MLPQLRRTACASRGACAQRSRRRRRADVFVLHPQHRGPNAWTGLRFSSASTSTTSSPVVRRSPHHPRGRQRSRPRAGARWGGSATSKAARRNRRTSLGSRTRARMRMIHLRSVLRSIHRDPGVSSLARRAEPERDPRTIALAATNRCRARLVGFRLQPARFRTRPLAPAAPLPVAHVPTSSPPSV